MRIPGSLQTKRDENKLNLEPSFTDNQGFEYFKEATNSNYTTSDSSGLPKWMHRVMTPPDTSEMIPFELSLVNPGCIKRIYKEEIVQLSSWR